MSINRLIVLDDDPGYIDILSGFADALGLDFEGHTSYASFCISNMSNEDLCLIDIYMPDKDALDVILELAENSFSSSLAVMSGADEEIISSVEATVKKLDITFAGSLSKPIKLSKLSQLIDMANVCPNKTRVSLEKVKPSLESSLKAADLAIWFKNEYVYPVFQPQFSSINSVLTGLECLTRINHPELGNVSPFEFISVLEKCHLIDDYTLKLIDKSLEEISHYLMQDKTLTCSFNISAQNLDKDFADSLVQLFKRYQVTPSQITLELTESIAIQMNAEALYAISRLKLFGVKLSIDDFGTGYSSISQLVDLPFDEIKIDRSFVSQLGQNTKAQAIVCATFNLVSSLSFTLIVEGVETQAQLDFLQEQGNCIVQGFLLSKPLKANELNYFISKKIEKSRSSH